MELRRCGGEWCQQGLNELPAEPPNWEHHEDIGNEDLRRVTEIRQIEWTCCGLSRVAIQKLLLLMLLLLLLLRLASYSTRMGIAGHANSYSRTIRSGPLCKPQSILVKMGLDMVSCQGARTKPHLPTILE